MQFVTSLHRSDCFRLEPHSKPSSMDLEYREDETPSDRPQLQTLFANRPIAIQQYYWNRNT